MIEREHRLYYENRAAHATGLGERATDPKIAAVHYELALRYAIFSVRPAQAQARPDVVAVGEGRRHVPSERTETMADYNLEPETEQALK